VLWDVQRVRLLGLWALLAGDKADATQVAKILARDPSGAVPLLTERLQEALTLEIPHARLIADLDSDDFQVRERASRRLEADPVAEFGLRLALTGRPSPEVQRRATQALAKITGPREQEAERLVADLEGENAPEALRRLQAMGRVAEPALRRALLPRPRPDAGRPPSRLSPQARSYIQQALDQLKETDTSEASVTPSSVLGAVGVLERLGSPEAQHALQELARGPAETRVAREAQAALDRLEKRGEHP
jgi:hypothetical protein